jgi:hypothetical protein
MEDMKVKLSMLWVLVMFNADRYDDLVLVDRIAVYLDASTAISLRAST